MENPRETQGEAAQDAEALLDEAEGQNDATRLKALEDLHSSLESELERDEPQQGQRSTP